jgi:cation/acetate symporter
MRKLPLGLNGWLVIYLVALAALLATLLLAERLGVRREIISATLLGATLILYAVVGFVCRTAVPLQYYAVGRSVPAFQNGMATAADWISAASFVSLVGTIYATGYSATVFLMGWTGGFCLLALLVVPYMRKLGEFTLPDFLVRRYGGQTIRIWSALAVVICCFIYVVAQIFAVGLITSRMIGVDFQIGIYLGLSSVLLCSFLGGMRAITWTQVTQYVVILLGVLLSVTWLSVKQTGAPWSVLDYRDVMQKITQVQTRIANDPKELQLPELYAVRVAELDLKLKKPKQAIQDERNLISAEIRSIRGDRAQEEKYLQLEKRLRLLNYSETAVINKWQSDRVRYIQLLQSVKQPKTSIGSELAIPDRENIRSPAAEQVNFIALVLILCLGTVSMPHLLMRFQTTPDVAQARNSVSWALFFILAIYLCLPPLAMMMKLEVLTQVVGSAVQDLPGWLNQWSRWVPELVSFSDANQDGIVQANELYLGVDAVMLIMPEVAGMPYVFSVLIAAGGLAAALSTADGLLLAMTAALSRDLMSFVSFRYKTEIGSSAQNEKVVRERGMIGSKVTLLSVALVASYVAAQRPADIVTLVALAFSMAAATFFVPVVAGIFWLKANRGGALAAMIVGPVLTLYYWFSMTHLPGSSYVNEEAYWLGIRPVAAGIFGVLAAALAMLVTSLLTQKRYRGQNEAARSMREPDYLQRNDQF